MNARYHSQSLQITIREYVFISYLSIVKLISNVFLICSLNVLSIIPVRDNIPIQPPARGSTCRWSTSTNAAPSSLSKRAPPASAPSTTRSRRGRNRGGGRTCTAVVAGPAPAIDPERVLSVHPFPFSSKSTTVAVLSVSRGHVEWRFDWSLRSPTAIGSSAGQA
jgi:hypothetical protein